MRPRLDLSQKSGMLPAVLKLFQSNIRGTASPGPGAPPQGLLAFYWHFVSQAKGWFAAMFAASLAVALLDTVIPLFIGRLVSLMEATDRQAALAAQWPLLLGMVGLVLIVRPLVLLADIAIRHNALIPGATCLIRWQSHWHVVRQSWPFFQNDFAGRIANRVMQTANALRESAMASIRAVWYIGAYGAIAAHMRLITQFMFCLTAMNAALLVSTAGIGIWLWAQGSVSAGVVATALSLAWQVANVSGWVSWEVTGIFENIGVVQEGMQSIAVPHSGVDRPGAQHLEVSRGEVVLDGVTFGYGRRDAPPVLDDLSVEIRPGERVGLVGRSGAGKSTLVNLLLRFHDLEHGRILIDGQDIAQVTQESLRAAIGMVTQDTSLLHRSIAGNIRYGRPSASDAQIEAAARKAQAHEFIVGLRDWRGKTAYEAHVGERGVKLSGGQRQRIALARVILKDAPILVLDEATSSLDSEVEVAIQEELLDLMEGKTVIAIAHRLSTIARMDRLLVLEGGRIVEEGTHAELLRLGGHYEKLWRHQSGGFLADDVFP